MENSELKWSTDLWWSAYLLLKGIKIATYTVIGRGRVKCGFALSEEDWHKYKLEFNNSELIKYKTALESLKDLAY